MFKRNKAQGVSIIGPQDRFEGNLRAAGNLEVHGTIDGDVDAEGTINIGSEGHVTGTVRAPSTTVSGKVEGAVEISGHLHMRDGGKVSGEASYGSLQVDRGGVIEGRASAVPLALAEACEEDVILVDPSSAGTLAAQT